MWQSDPDADLIFASTKPLQEQERAAEEEEQREVDIARGNPLLNTQDFNMKRRWDDDVVFKNQARGTEKQDGKEFVNVSLPMLRLFSLSHTNVVSRICYALISTKGLWYVSSLRIIQNKPSLTFPSLNTFDKPITFTAMGNK